MNIKEMKRERNRLESEITESIKEFIRKTHLNVNDVELLSSHNIDGSMDFHAVTVDVSLPR